MKDNSFVVDEFDNVNHNQNIPEAHPILVIIFGTTMAEISVVLKAQVEGASNLVPFRFLVVDSLTYKDVMTRLLQNGYTEEQIEAAIPRSQYFHLVTPFSEDFDFENRLNKDWLSTIFEPALKRLASKPNAPGCAGTPAIGRARVEGNEQELRNFFERHIQELTQVRTETLALLPGVKVFVITTYRGGTGTGSTICGSAVLRSLLDNGSTIHLHTVMPCVYTGDDRAYANAYATLRENQWYHRFNGGVPIKGGRILKAPFDSATYTFVSNGTVTLSHVDALMQEAGIIRSYLRAPTQATINAREVDLIDVVPHDLEDRPMHVRIETAISIRTIQPGTQEYMVTEWVRQEVEATQARFEAWCQNETLLTEEESQLNGCVEDTIKALNLNLNALLTRLDPSPTPTNALRSFFEQANGMIGNMESKPIKQSMNGLPQQVRDAFLKFEGSWEDRVRQLATKLPQEINEYVMSKTAASPHLGLAALLKILDHLLGLSKSAAREAENEKKKRDAVGVQLGPAMNAVQEAKGILGFINADEVTRDAAHKTIGIFMAAALARAQQERFEYLVQVLEGEISSLDSRGKSMTIPSVTAALRNYQVEQMASIRKNQSSQLKMLKERLEDLSQQIERRSQVFQRAILYNGMNREKLNSEVQNIRIQISSAPPIMRFFEGKQELRATLDELLPLLPSYAESGRSLTDIINADQAKRRLVVQLLRSRMPFTPLDREVEDQQGLRNRRDDLIIFELPGGQDGVLSNLLKQEGIVTNLNQVVGADDDEIRMYYMRDGLPYSAIRPLTKYQERHEHYLSRAEVITPYTVQGADQLPGLEPARVNLRIHTESILYLAKAVLPHRIASKPSGGFILSYEKDTGQGFTVTDTEEFTDFDSVVRWLAKRVEERKTLESELKRNLDDDQVVYKRLLIAAWREATGKERDYLQDELFRLKVNPHIFYEQEAVVESQSSK